MRVSNEVRRGRGGVFFTLADPPEDMRQRLLVYPGVHALDVELPPERQRRFRVPYNLAPVLGLPVERPPALDVIPEALAAQLRGYQRKAVELALRQPARYLAFDPGLGKSRAAAVIATLTGSRTLIVAPKTVAPSWKRELTRLGLLQAESEWYECESRSPDRRALREAVRAARWVFCNYDILLAHGGLIYDLIGTVIFDECTAIKTRGAQRSKASRQATAGAKRVLGLSGTPMPNRTQELWAPLDILEPHGWGSYFGFTHRYCGMEHNGFGWAATGVTNDDELRERLATIMSIETKESAGHEMPALSHHEFVVKPTGPLPKLDGVTMDNFIRFLSGGGSLGAATLERLNELRFAASALKVPAIVEHVASLISAGARPLVFTWYREIAVAITKGLAKLGFDVGYVHGGLSDKARNMTVDNFCARAIQHAPGALVSTYGCLGLGVDGLQHASSTVVLADYDWKMMTLTQAIDRVFRDGQKLPVDVWHTTMEGTFDRVLLEALRRKESEIARVIRADGHVDDSWGDESALRRDAEAFLQDGRELPQWGDRGDEYEEESA